jgi:hypothetical protein
MPNILEGIWTKITQKPLIKESISKQIPVQEVRLPLPAQEIAIRKKQSIVLPSSDSDQEESKMQLQLEAIELGFIFDEKALNALASHSQERESIFKVLQALVGADKVWKPMYPNFPQQVHEAPIVELFFNAMGHYITGGIWRPDYVKKLRLPLTDKVKLKPIGLISDDEYFQIFNEMLSSNASLSKVDQDIVHSFVCSYEEDILKKHIPSKVPFKETRCQLIAEGKLANMRSISKLPLSTATDVLRTATYLSHGDMSLATNTRFRLSNSNRRWLVGKLEPVINADDIVRHKGKWKRLFHCLHIGTFEDAPQSRELASKLRNGKLQGHNGIIEEALANESLDVLLNQLSMKPGEFARRTDHLLRLFSEDDAKTILERFSTLISDVDTRVLVQMLGHFIHRQECQDTTRNKSKITRVAIPKGQIAKVMVLKDELPVIAPIVLQQLIEMITNTLTARFSQLPNLGKVWIDPELRKSPVPLQMRTAAEGLKVVQRGTRLPMGDKNILRFFVHWVGVDIDLSACFLSDDLKFHSEIAYYALRRHKSSSGYKAVHSGDITYAPAPDGACEFIDIELDSILDKTIRYITMDVRVFEGGSFPTQQANAGWMFREKLGKEGEIFDARSVEQRISISASSDSCMVAVFDIKKREVIWLDLPGSSNRLHSGNNVANNRFNIEDLLEASLNFHQISIYDLLELHASSRGEIVTSEKEADLKLGEDLLYQSNVINSDYLK